MLTPGRPGRLRRARWSQQRRVGWLVVNGISTGGRRCLRHPEGNREAKRRHVMRGTVRQVLVYDGERCVGWCQFGSPPELPRSTAPGRLRPKGRRSAGLADRLHLHQREGPRQGRRRRCGRGSARGDQKRAGGGIVEAYPEQTGAAAAAAWRLSAHRTGGSSCMRDTASRGYGRSRSGGGSCAPRSDPRRPPPFSQGDASVSR